MENQEHAVSDQPEQSLLDAVEQVPTNNQHAQPAPSSTNTSQAHVEPSKAQENGIDTQESTQQTNISEATSSTTIQVPAVPERSTPSKTSALPQPHPSMSVEDLLSLHLVVDPQISPNGRWIAFTTYSSQIEPNRTMGSIWLVPADRSQPPRQITNDDHLTFYPRWSPDGRSLAFLSDRSGSVQIYLLSMQGGESQQISQISQGVNEYSWRPDGLAFLVSAPWKPSDEQLQQSSGHKISEVYLHLDESWDGSGYKQGRHTQLWQLSLEGRNTTRISAEPIDFTEACWSPDSKKIAFCANRRPDPDLSVSKALWVLTLHDGELVRLSPEEGLAIQPSWSPDGTHIAFYYTVDQTETGNIYPCIVSAQGDSSPRPALDDIDQYTCLQMIVDEQRSETFTPIQWYSDDKALLSPIQQRGQVHLYKIDLEQQQLSKLTNGNGSYLSPSLSSNDKCITLIRSDWFTPGDVWCLDGGGQNLRKLTGVNDPLLRSRQLTRPKKITWQGAVGQEIEGWLYLPPLKDGQKVPLILEVHGGPSLAWGDRYVHEFQVMSGKGFAVLAANPRGSLGYGEEFCRKNLEDWGGLDFLDLMAGLDYVVQHEPIDGTRLGISGLSYGGYMTNWAITGTNRFKAAVSRNGISSLSSAGLLSDQMHWFQMVMPRESREADLQTKRSPLTYAQQIHTPLLLLHAEDDLRCPISESLQLFVTLRSLKKPVELVKYPGASHLMDWPTIGAPLQRQDRLRRTIAWFDHFI